MTDTTYLSQDNNTPKPTSQSIFFTLFKDAEGQIGKKYSINENNTLEKTTGAKFENGRFDLKEISLSEIPYFLEKMFTPEYLITQGINNKMPDGVVPSDARRTKRHFQFAPKPGLLTIDSDEVQHYGITTIEELRDVLIDIEPALKEAPMYMVPSASSNIHLDGNNVTGLRGVHTFIPIMCTTDNLRILETLHKKAIKKGYHHVKISKAGTALARSPIDTAMKTPNQPVFSSMAILEDERLSQEVKCLTWNLDKPMLVPAAIKDLSKADSKDVGLTIKTLKSDMEATPECREIRSAWVESQVIKLLERTPGMTEETARATINSALRMILGPDFIIIIEETGEEVTVRDILNNPSEYHNVDCLHPLEQEHHAMAMIFSDPDPDSNKKQSIHSFAHGGELFLLNDTQPKDNMIDEHVYVSLRAGVDGLNETCATINLSGVSVVVEELPDGFEFYSDVNFVKHKKKYKYQEQIISGNGDLINVEKVLAKEWLDHKLSRHYQYPAVFAPGQNLGKDTYNLFTGLAVEPMPGGDWSLMEWHIKNIICDGVKEHYEYVFDWLAFSFQYIEKMPGVVIVLSGPHGAGKGVFIDFLLKIWGRHGIHLARKDQLSGKFNGHLATVCFVNPDEAFFAGDKENEGALKNMITNDTIVVERKGVQAESQRNYTKMIMTTNNDHVVAMEPTERRYCCLKVPLIYPKGHSYWDRLREESSHISSHAAFLYDMLQRDISNFNPRDYPETAARKEQVSLSLKSDGKFFSDGIALEGFKINGVREWRDEIKPDDFYTAYEEFCKSKRLSTYDTMEANKFFKVVASMGIEKKRLRSKGRSNKLENYYVMGRLEEFTHKFNTKYVGEDLDDVVCDNIEKPIDKAVREIVPFDTFDTIDLIEEDTGYTVALHEALPVPEDVDVVPEDVQLNQEDININKPTKERSNRSIEEIEKFFFRKEKSQLDIWCEGDDPAPDMFNEETGVWYEGYKEKKLKSMDFSKITNIH